MKLAATRSFFTIFLISVLQLAFISSAQSATVYKKIDEKGNLVFSDEPFEGAEKIDVQPIPTINLHLPKALPLSNNTPPARPPAISPPYASLSISSPINDSSIINTGGITTVNISSTPTLQNSHQYKLLVNGENKGTQTSGSFPLSGLTRGAHTAVAQIVDSKGAAIKVSPPVTFYVRQHSIRH